MACRGMPSPSMGTKWIGSLPDRSERRTVEPATAPELRFTSTLPPSSNLLRHRTVWDGVRNHGEFVSVFSRLADPGELPGLLPNSLDRTEALSAPARNQPVFPT